MAKSKPKVDPLDAVRISDPAAEKPPAEKPAPPPKPSKPKADAPKDTPPKVAKPTPPPVFEKYKCMAMAKRSYKGQMITLKLGKIVSTQTHSADFIAMLKKSGVPLEAVK